VAIETPALMRHLQLHHVSGIERHMGVSTDRSHDRALRDCDVVKDAAILQRDRDHMQVFTRLGLIEQNLRKLLRQRVQDNPTSNRGFKMRASPSKSRIPVRIAQIDSFLHAHVQLRIFERNKVVCQKRKQSSGPVRTRGKVNRRRPKRANLYAKKWSIFAKENMARVRPNKPSQSDYRKRVERV